MTTIDISETQEILTVSRLNREVRFALEGSFSILWVEGEMSNFAAPNSGHWYFSLKDANAQVRCAMFRPQNRQLSFTAKDGQQVLVKARVSLYEGRGDFQLLVDYMEEVGKGKLRQAFEALKNRLLAAGLFEAERKKPLPSMPQSIGVITSPTGAAIRDILSVLKRRYPNANVIIYPTLVQGESAAPNIINALHIANHRQECDVLILARGGGSLEDLWPFNEETVAYKISQTRIPIISGIGHEVDFTIADFVADHRAPTPSAAAELITPDQSDLLQQLHHAEQRITRQIHQKIRQIQQTLTWANKHLQQHHPKRRLTEQQQQIDRYEISLIQLQNTLIKKHETNLTNLRIKLASITPLHRIRDLRHQLNLQSQRLTNLIAQQLQYHQQQCGNMAAKLDGISPLATLKRGYAIASKNQKVLQYASEVKTGDKINVQLLEGSLDCTVDKTH